MLLVRHRTRDSLAENHRVVALGKLLTPKCLCHQAA